MTDSVLGSLSAFSAAVAEHYYAAAEIEIASKISPKLGQLHKLEFWQTDLLAGLLMQALLIATNSFQSSEDMLHRLSENAAWMTLNVQGLQQDLLIVPGMQAVCPGTEWMCLFWKFLQSAVDWTFPDPADDGIPPVASFDQLDREDCLLTFVSAHAKPAKAVPKTEESKQSLPRHPASGTGDCLAVCLFEALQDYVSSNQAVWDGNAIQQWLCSYSQKVPKINSTISGL